MAKSIKLKNDTYIDSSSVSHNRTSLNTILDSLNAFVKSISLDEIAVTDTAEEKIVATYKTEKTGIYLITGVCHPNYYGQVGRDLFTNIKQNNNIVWNYDGVLNSDAWMLSRSICCVLILTKNDVITFTVQNSVAGKNYSFGGGILYLVKLK